VDAWLHGRTQYGQNPTVPRFPELERPLTNGQVVVRFGEERDIPEILIAYQDDRELHLRMDQERPPSGAELGRRAERAQGDRAAGRAVTFTILEPDSDVCRGQIYVHSVDWDNLRAEVGIWVAPGSRRRGLASGALALVARWLLRESRLERVQVATERENERMIRCAQSAGFSYEGVLRAYTLEQGSRVDNAVLSMVRRDLEG
jgi:RimJ/RimL family protein N-acetyltransferase